MTLVFQGLTLPWLIQKIQPEDTYTVIPEPRQARIIQQIISRNSLQFLEKTGLSNARITNLSERLNIDLSWLEWEPAETGEDKSTTVTDSRRTYLDWLAQQQIFRSV